MRNTLQRKWAVVAIGGASLVSAVAIAAPWDVDMVDSDAVRGYECWQYETDSEGNRKCVRSMGDLPEGVQAQSNILTPNHVTMPDYPKGDARWDSVSSPLTADDKVMATGERMYDVYCSPCHGKVDAEGSIPELGTVAQPGRIAGVVGLTGAAGVLQNRSDGRVYSTIRLGNAIMPAYNWAMTETEMWSIVHYVRTLDNGAYAPPQPETAADETANENGGAQ